MKANVEHADEGTEALVRRKDVLVMQYPNYSENDSTFRSAIFDFSFSRFVAIPIAKVLYVIVFVLAALEAVVLLIGGLIQISQSYGGGLLGLLMLFAAPVLFLLTITLSRLVLETFVIVFRLREDTSALREIGERSQAPTERV
jgi:hypothetical protein